MIREKVVNRSDEIHPCLKRLGLLQETAPAPHQTGQACAKRGVQTLYIGCVDHHAALGGLHQTVDLGFGSLNDATHDTDHMPVGIKTYPPGLVEVKSQVVLEKKAAE